jgi:hypothetical protein
MNSPLPPIDDLRREFKACGLQGYLWELISEALRLFGKIRIATRYNPRIYSPSGSWDEEGLSDLVNDFIVHRGIEKGAVLAALQRADNTNGFVYYLESAFRNFAISQRVRTIADNLYRRLIDALADDPQLVPLAGMGTRSAYGLASWQNDPPACLDEGEMQVAMRSFPNDVETLSYDSEQRQSPLLAVDELRRIAHAVIEGMGKLVTARQLMLLIKMRYSIDGSLDHASLETIEDPGSLELHPLQDLIARELAERLFRELTERQRAVLKSLMADDPPPSVREIAARLGLSKSVVQRERDAIAEAINSLELLNKDEQSQVLGAAAGLIADAS